MLTEIDKDLKPTGRSVTKRITYVTGYAQKPEWVEQVWHYELHGGNWKLNGIEPVEG